MVVTTDSPVPRDVVDEIARPTASSPGAPSASESEAV